MIFMNTTQAETDRAGRTMKIFAMVRVSDGVRFSTVQAPNIAMARKRCAPAGFRVRLAEGDAFYFYPQFTRAGYQAQTVHHTAIRYRLMEVAAV